MPTKIKKCKKCGSLKIKFRDCGYSSFNPGGGKCSDCGYEVMSYVTCLPTKDDLVKAWNKGQTLTTEEKLKIENKKLKEALKAARA